MQPTLCHECEHRPKCEAFGLSSKLAARLMIGRMVTKENDPFPFSVYLPQMQSEGVNKEQVIAFMDALKHDCLYLK